MDLKPSRELDALIAEKVMGGGRDTHVGQRLMYSSMAERDEPPTLGWDFNIKPYSTDIAAAWEVVDKIKQIRPDGSSFGLNIEYEYEFAIKWYDKKYFCGWYPINLDGVPTLEGEGESAPHAICLAALAVMESKPADKINPPNK